MTSRSHQEDSSPFLSVWRPIWRTGDIEVAGPPSDPDGQEIHLFDGKPVDDTVLHFRIERDGEYPDFLYNRRLFMIVSPKALQVIQSVADDSAATASRVRLTRAGHNPIESYSWLNIKHQIPVLDESSIVDSIKTSSGHFVRIDGFAILPGLDIQHHLFVCRETGSKILSRKLATAVKDEKLTGCKLQTLQGLNWPF